MRKFLSVVLLSLAVTFLLAGCSPNNAGNTVDENGQGGTMNDHEINIPQTGWTALVPNK